MESNDAARLEAIEARLARIEKAIYIPAERPAPQAVPEAVAAEKAAEHAAPVQEGPRFYLPSTKPLAVKSQSSAGAGEVLGIVGIIFFVLAAAYMVKLAVDSGWLTPLRQWASAMTWGVGLIGAGLYFRERDEQYFSLLPGAGVIVLYLAAYAGHLHFGLYGPLTTLGILVAVSLVSIALFYQFQQIHYVVTAMLGSYLVPWLVPLLQSEGTMIEPYFFCWDIVFCVLAVMVRQRGLILLAAYLGLGVYGLSHPSLFGGATNDVLENAAIFQALQFFFFAAGILLYSLITDAAMTVSESWSALPVMLFFYGLEYSLIQRLLPESAPELALGFGLFVLLLYMAARKWKGPSALASGPMVSGMLSVIVFHAFYLQRVPHELGPWLGLVLMVALPLVARFFDLSRHWLVAAAALLVIFIEFGRVLLCLEPLNHDQAAWFGVVYALLFLAAAVFPAMAGDGSESLRSSQGLLLAFGHLQAMTGISRLIDTMQLGSSGLILSVAWGLYGLALVLLGFSVKDRLLARSALGVFIVAVLKALLYDVATADGIVRVLAFLGLGLVLYAAGWLFKKIQGWDA